MLICNSCRGQFAEDDFAIDARRSTGRQAKCRVCQKAYRVANKERIKAYHQRHYQENRTQILKRTSDNSKRRHKETPGFRSAYNKKYHAENAREIIERKRRTRLANREARAEYARRYHVINAAKKSAAYKAWYAANREKVLAKRSKWAKDNPAKCVAATRRRDAKKLRATPSWADQRKILEFYEEAARLTKITGIRHEVDHAVPLQGKNVCGLHCEANLQIMTKAKNIAKYNRWQDDAVALQDNA
jgi:hypothetical protein